MELKRGVITGVSGLLGLNIALSMEGPGKVVFDRLYPDHAMPDAVPMDVADLETLRQLAQETRSLDAWEQWAACAMQWMQQAQALLDQPVKEALPWGPEA